MEKIVLTGLNVILNEYKVIISFVENFLNMEEVK